MPASIDDLLTTQKNGVVAINGLAQATARSLGTQTSATITTATVIHVGNGYLVNCSVVVAGSTVGTISNTSAVSTVAAANALCAIPATVGVVKLGQIFSTGLVVTPGTGQSLNVTYSPG
jgi:hypothetical protein